MSTIAQLKKRLGADDSDEVINLGRVELSADGDCFYHGLVLSAVTITLTAAGLCCG
jgi:hypothetical protein